ncbi:MAG: nickel pincer cofactor biosynthesis protein LarB [Syntrophales bacterium]|nr:nickel pincer cofactor biosynthesis protein LarB [Syntrophales bacterium]
MREELVKILNDVKDGKLDVHEALDKLRLLPYDDLFFAKVDHHRALRKGVPEVIYCPGKTDDQLLKISRSIWESGTSVIGTRCTPAQFDVLAREFKEAKYYEEARIFFIPRGNVAKSRSKVTVITAGTSDIPVAEEAAIASECMGLSVQRIYDVGVAGIHRLFPYIEQMNSSAVIIVVAGMEGALPGIVAGFTDKPVIAVPTSVGYGAQIGGFSALLTMLNCCAGGVAVVNIDNGFGAAYFAYTIINQIDRG